MRGLSSLFHKTPSQAQEVSTHAPQSGLSPEFIKKYGLSNREAEGTAVLVKGNSNKAISAHLKIEVDTVKTHLKNIYRKTGIPGRYALMAFVGFGGTNEQLTVNNAQLNRRV
jgi:DNA-binding NarL/FixJ family response regulator